LRLPSGSLREIARNKNRGLFTSKITEFNHKVGALHFINAPYKIRRSLSHTPSVSSFPNYLILPELYTVQLAAKSVNFRLYGALKPKTISC
ncbi:MAG: hypothetical protein ACKOQS_06630, partial [Dolichospermum sp.]